MKHGIHGLVYLQIQKGLNTVTLVVLVFGISLIAPSSLSQDNDAFERPVKLKKKKKLKAQVVDIEGDVIEGDDQRPDLLTITNERKVDLDSFMYLRDNFHDFQRFDRKKRTGVSGRP